MDQIPQGESGFVYREVDRHLEDEGVRTMNSMMTADSSIVPD